MTQRKKEFMRTVKFILCSASAGIIQAVSFAVLEEVVHLEHWLCNLIALVLSVLWNFTLNRKFTFCSASNVPVAMAKVAAFYVVFAPLSAWWMNYFTGIGWNAYAVQIGTMLLNFVLEYLYQRFFVFGKSLDTATKEDSHLF